MGVKISIPNINKTIEALKKFDGIIFQTTTRLKLLLLQNWSNGKGADDRGMPGLTDIYKNRKTKSGRKGIRDLTYSGNMRQDLDPVKKADAFWKLAWQSSQERKKAQGNVGHAGNMMTPISDRIDKKLQRLAFDLYKKIKR